MTRKQLLLLGAKLVFSGLLLWLVLTKIDVAGIVSRLRSANVRWLIPALLAGPLVTMLSAGRWQILSLGLLCFGEAVRYTWIGLFFGSIVPGVVGGDVAKGVSLAAKNAGARDARLPMSIVVDKFVGFWVLLLQFNIVAWLMLHHQPQLLAGIRGAVKLASGATVVGLIAAAALCHPRGATWFNTAAARLPIPALRNFVIRVLAAFSSYRGEGRRLLQAALISFVIHGVNAFCFWLVMHSLAIPASLWFAAVFYPLLSGLLALPVSVSGVGVRDVFAAGMFTAFGLNPESGVAFSWLLLGLSIPNSLIGGIIQLGEIFLRRATS